MSTAHPPMRPSSRPPSKVPTMPPTKSLIPPVPFQTSSPCSHWSSSEFAERSPHHGPFHSQSSVPFGPTFSYRTAPHIRSRSCFVANISLPGTANIHDDCICSKLPPGSTTGGVSKVPRADGVSGALGMGQQIFRHRTFNAFRVHTVPFAGAIAADYRSGRFDTILVFSLIYLCVKIVHLASICINLPPRLVT